MQIVWSRLDQMLHHVNVCLCSIHKDSIIASSLATVQNNSNCSCPRPLLNVCIAIFVQVFHFNLKVGLPLHQNGHVMFVFLSMHIYHSIVNFRLVSMLTAPKAVNRLCVANCS